MGDLFWLSDEAWAAIEPHLPKNQPGARRVDDRRVISGIRSPAPVSPAISGLTSWCSRFICGVKAARFPVLNGSNLVSGQRSWVQRHLLQVAALLASAGGALDGALASGLRIGAGSSSDFPWLWVGPG